MSTETQIALMQAQDLPAPTGAEVPDWVHLLPGGPTITTVDGRGPYRVADAAAVVTASLHGSNGLPIDENHSIDRAAPLGHASPARGHIVELQSRTDGIWGRVEWNATGRALLTERAYGGISPAIKHDRTGRVLKILRASLVNRPNLRGLTALHQEETMSLNERLAELLGLDASAGEDALVERVTALHAQAARSDDDAGADTVTALQSQIAGIGQALGLADTAGVDAILTAARAAAGEGATIVALQAELNQVAGRLNDLSEASAREKATAYVDAEIRRGRVGIKPKRDYYIALHMQDADTAVSVIEAMMVVKPDGSPAAPPVQTSLHDATPTEIVARARAYQKKLADGGMEIDFPSAVVAIREGKQ